MRILKELRRNKKITQDKLATDLGVSRSTISMWEIDASEPDGEMTRRIANYFDTTTDYLLGRTDDLVPSEQDQDDEFWELRREMSERKEMKTLFDLAKGAKKEDLEFANDLLKRLRGDEE